MTGIAGFNYRGVVFISNLDFIIAGQQAGDQEGRPVLQKMYLSRLETKFYLGKFTFLPSVLCRCITSTINLISAKSVNPFFSFSSFSVEEASKCAAKEIRFTC